MINQLEYEELGPPKVREIPKITREEDLPWPDRFHAMTTLREQDHKMGLDMSKHIFAKRMVLWSFISILLLILLDSIMKNLQGVSSDLITSAFEMFKLVCMTSLGFLFGVKHT